VEALGVGVEWLPGKFVADITYATTTTDKQTHANITIRAILFMATFIRESI